MGGIGDLMILSSSLRELKAQNPESDLVLATAPENVDFAHNFTFVDRVIPIHELPAGNNHFSQRYDLRMAVEPANIGEGKLSWEKYISMDRSDIFDELLGVKSKKRFSLRVCPGCRSRADESILAGTHAPRIGLMPFSKSPLRSMPLEYIEPLIHVLVRELRATVFLLGETGGWANARTCQCGEHNQCGGINSCVLYAGPHNLGRQFRLSHGGGLGEKVSGSFWQH
jgi:ADP-heptose:LPS heptosyltransferase